VILFNDLMIGLPSMLYRHVILDIGTAELMMFLNLGKNIILNAKIVLDDVSLCVALEFLQEKYRFCFKDCFFGQEFFEFFI
jgi:hypothetical protein